jgi:hypothetical protein
MERMRDAREAAPLHGRRRRVDLRARRIAVRIADRGSLELCVRLVEERVHAC